MNNLPPMPSAISAEAQDIIRRLLEKNSRKRLGSGERGFEEIKSHPFFQVLIFSLCGYCITVACKNLHVISGVKMKLTWNESERFRPLEITYVHMDSNNGTFFAPCLLYDLNLIGLLLLRC